jgi:competence protein ComEC
VYHDLDCSSLPMEKNRVYFSSSEEAENAGYRKCGRCGG